jgi:hypothetical protein
MIKNLKMTFDNVNRVRDRIKELGAQNVLVGIPSQQAMRENDEDENPEVNNAMLGFIHENGSPAQNIPARPWLIPAMQENKDQIADQLEGGIRANLEGKDVASDVILHRVGIVAMNAARKKIIDGPFVPLSPVTIAKRRAKGRTGVRPLNDTGQMRNAVTYVID